MNTARYYRPGLDVLRFCAFLAVFAHHALPETPAEYTSARWPLPPWAARLAADAVLAGGYGVDLFFALSSFLITELLLREYDATGGLRVGAFYARRCLRIWPLYFAFLLLDVTLFPAVLPGEPADPLTLAAFGSLFLGNWLFVAGRLTPSVVGPLWSVSIEEQFYAAWPLLLKRAGPRRLAPLAAALWAASAGVRVALAWAGVRHPAVFCNTFAHLDPIAAGALAAAWLHGRGRRPPGWTLAAGGGAAAAALVGAAHFRCLDGWPSVPGFAAVAAASAVLVVAFLDRPAGGAAGGALAYLGTVSYGLYVYHLLALHLTARLGLPGRYTVPLALALCVALAAASYRWLERPFLRLKGRFAAVPSR